MVGRAMFTTVMSRMIMSWAPSTRARAIPRRSSRRARPWPRSVVIRAIDDVDMNAFLERSCGPGRGGECSPARPALATMEVEATSDNYTEVPSALQLDLVRADEHDRRARPGGRRLPGGFRAIGVWGVPRGHSVPPGRHRASDARGRAAQLRA